MITQLLSSRNGQEDIQIAARILRAGGLVAIPTETVYGLAADAFNPEAIRNIFKAKGRPQDNPLIVHIADLDALPMLVTSFPESARKLAAAFWPGPLTMVLPKAEQVPGEVSAWLSTVAVRFPSHPIVRQIILAAGTPLAAPSANLSGCPSPTSAEHVFADLSGRIDAIFDGGVCDVGVESTVIALNTPVPTLLRPGGVTLEQLQEVVGEVLVAPAVLNQLKDGEVAASPGMKYKHYAPKCHVILVKGSTEQYIAYVNAHQGENVAALCYEEDVKYLLVDAIPFGKKEHYDEMAHELFDRLRELDQEHFSTVYARCPDPKGVGLAVYNRLIRAAGFEVITLGDET